MYLINFLRLLWLIPPSLFCCQSDSHLFYPLLARYNFDMHEQILIIFGRMLPRRWAIKRCFFPHLTWLVYLHYLRIQERETQREVGKLAFVTIG